MADYTGYDPYQADYDEGNGAYHYPLAGAIIALATFAFVGVGFYLTYGLFVTEIYIINGTTYMGLTLAEAVELDAALAAAELPGAGPMASGMHTLINRWMMASQGLGSFNMEDLIMYHHEFHNQQDYQDFIDHLENDLGADCWGSPETQTYCIF